MSNQGHFHAPLRRAEECGEHRGAVPEQIDWVFEHGRLL
jgi:hypothetical protein